MKCLRKYLIMFVLCILTMSLPLSADAAAKISRKSVTLIKGQTAAVSVIGASKKVKWSTNKKAVASITQNGKIKAKKKGKAVITAKVGKQKLTCKVSVETPKISASEVNLEVTETAQLKMSGTQQKITWKSDNSDVVTVTSKGSICAKKSGIATVTATINGKKYNCHVTVEKPAGSGNADSGNYHNNHHNNQHHQNQYNQNQQGTGCYVLNINSMKFHHASCSSAKRISAENYSESNKSRDALIALGYDPCGNCHP